MAEAWSLLSEASLMIERELQRTGLPNAWCQVLLAIKPHRHIPQGARRDWEFLTNEMARSIESSENGRGMTFMEGIPDADVSEARSAFARIYQAVLCEAIENGPRSRRKAAPMILPMPGSA